MAAADTAACRLSVVHTTTASISRSLSSSSRKSLYAEQPRDLPDRRLAPLEASTIFWQGSRPEAPLVTCREWVSGIGSAGPRQSQPEVAFSSSRPERQNSCVSPCGYPAPDRLGSHPATPWT